MGLASFCGYSRHPATPPPTHDRAGKLTAPGAPSVVPGPPPRIPGSTVVICRPRTQSGGRGRRQYACLVRQPQPNLLPGHAQRGDRVDLEIQRLVAFPGLHVPPDRPAAAESAAGRLDRMSIAPRAPRRLRSTRE